MTQRMTQQLALGFAPPEPTFENFYAGPNARAVEVLRAGREQFVYLWGAAGSGRSHLLTAARALDPALDIADDVDALAMPEQITLFDRYNETQRNGTRLLAAGNAPPAQLRLREDLRTRVGMSLVFELHALDDDARLAALHAHARDRGLKRVPDEVFEHIARRVPRDMGTQMAVLHALDRYSLEQKRTLTLALAREVLAQHAF